jgi:signal transduction histidine kinase
MQVTTRAVAAWRSLDRRLVDAFVAALLCAVMVAELATKTPVRGESAATPLAYLWAVVITLPFAAHRRWPVAVVAVTAAAIVGYAAGHFPAYPGYAAFALVLAVAMHAGKGRGALACGALTVALNVSLAVQSDATVSGGTWFATVLLLGVAWLAGENLRARQERWAAARDRARQLEAEREERARQAVTEERLRIARELHDVVAHAMSVVAVQAGVAHHVIDSRPELAREALGTVETTTRAALVEMRRLLGVLRAPDEPAAALQPTPGLADVDALAAQLAGVGLAVRVTVEGTPEPVPGGVDLSAYRIVQEGLTNVLRHGGPAAEVTVRHRPGLVTVEIRDDGRPGPASTAGAGQGLIGMAERVAVFGGELTAGPRPGGGWQLVAALPFGRATAPVGGAA